jgi:hypothetical protein
VAVEGIEGTADQRRRAGNIIPRFSHLAAMTPISLMLVAVLSFANPGDAPQVPPAPATSTAPAPVTPATTPHQVAPAPVLAARPTTQAPSPATKSVGKTQIANPNWKDLSTAQQQALAPLSTVWDGLDNFHKAKWLVMARRFPAMKPDEQNRIQERMRAWVALTPEQRRVARESYARTKKLDTNQKSEQWQQYQQLPEDQKQKLAAEAAKSKVAALPSGQSKTKTVARIKSTQKQQLQQSVMPKPRAAEPVAPGSSSSIFAPTTDR